VTSDEFIVLFSGSRCQLSEGACRTLANQRICSSGPPIASRELSMNAPRPGEADARPLTLPLSIPRRIVCDLIHFAHQIPTVPVQRMVDVSGSIAREQAGQAP
jgi:hypothetical protein